ncbi:hypothetical protein EG329_005488 [Mollisiaceae sp. DMI_Dod_QoI]|nr:hypothetical protein EG329_005488 [Helotiales sp. DMI_Dod_QoI]
MPFTYFSNRIKSFGSRLRHMETAFLHLPERIKSFSYRKLLRNASFTCFSNLPTELRLMIWESALPGPHIIEIRYHFPSVLVYTSNTKAIAALYYTCRESHNAVLGCYNRYYHNSIGRFFWFDKRIDTLYIPDEMTLNRFVYPYLYVRSRASNSHFARNLAILAPFEISGPGRLYSLNLSLLRLVSAEHWYRLLMSFSDLKQITFVWDTGLWEEKIPRAEMDRLFHEFRAKIRSVGERFAAEQRIVAYDGTMIDNVKLRIVEDSMFS